ncbi:MAG: hypothetical protein CVU95_04065 [Firmicutes bacterium HGW-Firmicutes-2]|nr:MAG: hypothetical protein CVU95_04065 [Firmicutes bacterium HGW-Firmicutes-2]
MQYIYIYISLILVAIIIVLVGYIVKLKNKIKHEQTSSKLTTTSISDLNTTRLTEEMGTILLSDTCGEQELQTALQSNLTETNASNTMSQTLPREGPSIKEGDLLNNKYRIDHILGSGSQGSVYVCTNVELGNQWAVKHFSGSMNEKDILVKLNHVSLPKIADLFEDKRGIFIIESLVEGQSLYTLLNEGENFQEKDVINWMVQICEALQYIHNKNILHMDIKPQNILITEDNKVILIDFGIATYIDKDEEDYITYGYSPIFSSPEQEGGLKKVDERSDIYALGATMYYLFTRISPKNNHNIKDFCPFLSDEFASIIHTCLEKDSQMRFFSANELKKILLDLQNKNTRMNKNTTIHIGITGTCVGAGVTHTAFLCGGVLAQQKYKTAVVEMTDVNCFKFIVESEKDYDEDLFTTMNHIDIYKYQEDMKNMQEVYKKNYDYIIYDFGSMTFFGEDSSDKKSLLKQANFTEFIRCDRKIVVVGMQFWQVDGIKAIYEKSELFNHHNFVFAFPIINGAKTFKKRFKSVKCVDIPCCEPFKKSQEVDKIINNILN